MSNKGYEAYAMMSSLRRTAAKPQSEEMHPMLRQGRPTSPPGSRGVSPVAKSRSHHLYQHSTLEIDLRDHSDATAKRGFRVQVPKKLLLYALLVFLIMPLVLSAYIMIHRIIFGHDEYHDAVASADLQRPPDLWEDEEETPLEFVDPGGFVAPEPVTTTTEQEANTENNDVPIKTATKEDGASETEQEPSNEEKSERAPEETAEEEIEETKADDAETEQSESAENASGKEEEETPANTEEKPSESTAKTNQEQTPVTKKTALRKKKPSKSTNAIASPVSQNDQDTMPRDADASSTKMSDPETTPEKETEDAGREQSLGGSPR